MPVHRVTAAPLVFSVRVTSVKCRNRGAPSTRGRLGERFYRGAKFGKFSWKKKLKKETRRINDDDDHHT